MLNTAHTERFGDFTILVRTAEGYTVEDGIMTVDIFHAKRGLLDCHTDGMNLKDARENAKDFIERAIANSQTFYMGFDEVEILGLHNDKVLLKDSSDYIIASETAFVWARFSSYADIREYCMNNSLKGFSPYFNRNDIHHALELV